MSRTGWVKIGHAFCDDAIELSGRLPNFNLCASQLSRGVFQSSLQTIASPEFQILEIRMNQKVHALGGKPKGSLVFAIPMLSAKISALAHAVRLPSANCVFGFDDQREVDLVTAGSGCQLVIVAVSKRLFQHYAARAGRHDLDNSFLRRNVLQVPSPILMPLVRYLQQVLYMSQQKSAFLQSVDSANLLEEDLLPLLIQALRPTSQIPTLRPLRRSDVVTAAREFMEDNLQRPLTLDEICQTVSSSKRALTYGFKDVFEMGPMAFLKVQRLNGIRQALLAADPTQQMVADLAYAWGFWSLGHFARDYKQMFGETPSETLRRHRV